MWPFSAISRLERDIKYKTQAYDRAYQDYINAGNYVTNLCNEVNYLRSLLRDNGIEFEQKNIREG